MISKFYFSNIFQPQITTLNSGITLYTRRSKTSYGSLCIMFRGGTCTENYQQQGSLLTLKILHNLQINKFLFDSQSMADYIVRPQSHYTNCIFLNEDTDNAVQYLCNLAFSKQQISQQLSKVSNYLSFSQQKNHGSIAQILLKLYFPQISLLDSIPQNEPFESYQATQITKNNCIIGYQGIKQHEEIIDIFEKVINQYQEFLERDFKPNYQIELFKSQTIRIENQITSDFEVILLFQGPTLQDQKESYIDMILREVLGDLGFYNINYLDEQPGEIGFKFPLFQVLQFNDFLINAGCISHSFSDFGFFGLYLKSTNTHKQETYELAIEEIKKLRVISDYELMRAKNILITKFYSNLQRQNDQLIYDLESIIYQGKLNPVEEFKDKINDITKEDIQNRIQQLIKPDKLTIIYIGKGSSLMPDEKLTMMKMQF